MKKYNLLLLCMILAGCSSASSSVEGTAESTAEAVGTEETEVLEEYDYEENGYMDGIRYESFITSITSSTKYTFSTDENSQQEDYYVIYCEGHDNEENGGAILVWTDGEDHVSLVWTADPEMMTFVADLLGITEVEVGEIEDGEVTNNSLGYMTLSEWLQYTDSCDAYGIALYEDFDLYRSEENYIIMGY